MTVHLLQPATAGYRCSCGTWARGTAPTTAVTIVESEHAAHVQREADWELIAGAVDIACHDSFMYDDTAYHARVGAALDRLRKQLR